MQHKFDYKNPCKTKASRKCEICHGKHITLMHPFSPKSSSNTNENNVTPIQAQNVSSYTQNRTYVCDSENLSKLNDCEAGEEVINGVLLPCLLYTSDAADE